MAWKLSSLVLTNLRVDNRFDSTNMLCRSGLEVEGGKFVGVACWDQFWVDPGGLLVGVMTFDGRCYKPEETPELACAWRQKHPCTFFHSRCNLSFMDSNQ